MSAHVDDGRAVSAPVMISSAALNLMCGRDSGRTSDIENECRTRNKHGNKYVAVTCAVITAERRKMWKR